MKRLLLSITTLAVVLVVGCSGGPTPVPPPPVGRFTNASLKGQYAFSMSGSEVATSGGLTSSFFTRVGSFIADGNGNITGGVEDVNLATGTSNFLFTGGTYSISADGRGTLKLVNSTGTLQFSITLATTSSGFMVAMPQDGLSTTSGSFMKQDTSAFSLSGIAGKYAFDLSGLDAASTPAFESLVGQFNADGNGSITAGQQDDNDASQPIPVHSSITGATYALDPTFPSDLTSFGRGIANISGVQMVFYVVDRTRVNFMETTSGGALLGSAVAQSSIPTNTNQISGGFVFVMGGTGSGGPLTRGGRFSASGGSLSTIFVDNNNAGVVSSQTPTTGTTTGTYTIDSSGSGRGTATFMATGQTNPFTFVFYLSSPTQGFLQDQSLNIIADGSLAGQPAGAISNASLGGNYAFNWSGIDSTDVTTDEEDFVGQLNLASGSITGNVDFNEFASGKQFFNAPVTGTLALSGDGTGHNTFIATLQTSPANTLPFFAYVANNNTILLMGTQKNVRVITGVLTPQP